MPRAHEPTDKEIEAMRYAAAQALALGNASVRVNASSLSRLIACHVAVRGPARAEALHAEDRGDHWLRRARAL